MSLGGVWKRYGCCPSDERNLPAPVPNLMILQLSGFIYRTIPVWFDETGQRLLDLDFSANPDILTYWWRFYKKVGNICPLQFYLSTSDDIVPVITETVSGKTLRVRRISRHNGYTSWMVTC